MLTRDCTWVHTDMRGTVYKAGGTTSSCLRGACSVRNTTVLVSRSVVSCPNWQVMNSACLDEIKTVIRKLAGNADR